MKWKPVVLVLAVLLGGSVLVLALLRLLARRPPRLGMVAGQLMPCPGKPNCVCSQATDQRQRMEPLSYNGTREQARAHLRALLAALPRTRVVTETETYLHVECTSWLFRFTDDVEFLFDPEQKV